jgi:membrane-associated phospholipid phosphatase
LQTTKTKRNIVKREKDALLLTARTISLVFTPFFLPVMGLIALFLFSYLSLMPLMYKITVTLMVWLFTVVMPQLLIRLYRHYQGWSLLKMLKREERMVPYIISIACYLLCLYIMSSLHMPHFMRAVLTAAVAIQIICAILNNWWKISTHTAAIGGTTGAVMAFAFIFGFNPLWWICALILLAGIVGTSRTLLRLHTLGEVTGGFFVGLMAGFVVVMFT